MTMLQPSERTVEEVVADWPETSMGQQGPKRTAEKMVEKYGPPDEATPSHLVWNDNGPWKRTEVHRDGHGHRFPVPHLDHLYQAIDYQVPPEKHADLARYDGSTHAHRTEGELVATCHREDANVLALNLADDVVTDEKTPEEAREAYAAVMAKLMAGRSPDYATAFQFPLPDGDQRDPDVTIIGDEVRRTAGTVTIVGLALVAAAYYLTRRSDRRESEREARTREDERIESAGPTGAPTE